MKTRTFNKFKIAVLSAAYISTAAFMPNAYAINQSATASAAARILAAISITKDTDLDFGDIFASTTGSTEASTLDATFTVRGTAGSAYSVSVPTSVVLTGAGSAMSATLSGTDAGAGAIGSNGTSTVTVSGALAVGANQAAGSYSGTFDVTVNYN